MSRLQVTPKEFSIPRTILSIGDINMPVGYGSIPSGYTTLVRLPTRPDEQETILNVIPPSPSAPSQSPYVNPLTLPATPQSPPVESYTPPVVTPVTPPSTTTTSRLSPIEAAAEHTRCHEQCTFAYAARLSAY